MCVMCLCACRYVSRHVCKDVECWSVCVHMSVHCMSLHVLYSMSTCDVITYNAVFIRCSLCFHMFVGFPTINMAMPNVLVRERLMHRNI